MTIGASWVPTSWGATNWAPDTWGAGSDCTHPIGPSWVDGSWACSWALDTWGASIPPGCDYPAESDVLLGVVYAFGTMTGTLAPGTGDYPVEGNVRDGIHYDFGLKIGNLTLPTPGEVQLGVEYGSGGVEFAGTLECLQPPTPVPPANGRTPFAAIASAAVTRLAVMLGVETAFIRPVANAHYTVTEAEDLFCYLQFFTPGKPRDPGLDFTDAGAGRLATPVGRRLRVYLYTRSGVDSYGGDEVALLGTDPSAIFSTPIIPPDHLGHFLAEERVYNALENWMPLDQDNEPLALTPFHPLDASEEPERPMENEAGLLRSCLDYEIVYLLSIDPSEPIG